MVIVDQIYKIVEERKLGINLTIFKRRCSNGPFNNTSILGFFFI